MSKKIAIPYKNTKLRVVGPIGYVDAYRIQRLEMPASLPNTTINELGNSKHAGITTDIPDITATINGFDVDTKMYATLCGQNASAVYPAAGLDVSNLSECDLILYVKDDSLNDHLKCVHGKKMRVTDFTFTYAVDAESTEEYTVAGNEKKYFANDIYVDTGTLSASGTCILTYEPKQLKAFKDTAGDYLVSFIVGSGWKTETTAQPPTADYYNVNPTSKWVTYSGSTNPEGLTYVAVYHLTANQMSWSDISAPAYVPAAIKGKNISISIGSESQYRVQSVTIRGTFPNTKIEEMGNILPVGYVVDPPDISGDISVLATDNELVALLATGNKDDGDNYGMYNVNEYEERTLQLDITIKSPTDNSTVVKALRIPYMRITSDGTSSNVGGQMTETFSFMSNDGQCIVFSGAAS